MNTKERLGLELSKLKDKELYRSLKIKEGLVDFCSNDYLGLSHSSVLLSILEKIKIKCLGSGGSRLLAGNKKETLRLENLLAIVHQEESALLFNSGYSANLAFFSTIPNKNSVIIYDSKVHACIKDGMRLSLAKKVSFTHNNLVQLEKRLKSAVGEKYVVVESIYSMDGDMAPLKEISDLCTRYHANLIVDEAHSTGNYGKYGAGLVSALGIKVFAKIHTFGKAIGAHGACVVSSETVKNYLINNARPFIFTTALPPHDVLVIEEIYKYLQKNYADLQNRLQAKIKLFKSTLNSSDIDSDSPIQVVIIPGNKEVKAISGYLEKKGFDVRPVLSPTVPVGTERLRICIKNTNSDQEIIDLATAINTYKSYL